MAAMLRGSLLSIALLLAGCASPSITPTPTHPDPASEWLAAYFSDPNAAGSEFTQGGPDEPLVEAIHTARVTIDLAIHDLNLYNVGAALMAAADRGVWVRMVVESENFTDEEIMRFTNAGISVVGDDDPDLMHDKFLVIDHYEVWTGSFNYTLTDAYGNRNNVVRLRSTQIAENYIAEFNEMFEQHLFGGGSPANTLYPQVSVNGTLVETYFGPEDNTLGRLVQLIANSNESVYMLAYSLTLDELGEALIAAQERGVSVHLVLDESQAANQGSEFERLKAAQIPIRLDNEGGLMHHKVMIIDGGILVTGSYNFSANAEHNNDENSLVIHDSDLASEFTEEFRRIWEISE